MSDYLRDLLTKIDNAAKGDLPCEATNALIARWSTQALEVLTKATHEERFISPWLTQVAVVPDVRPDCKPADEETKP